VNEKKKESMKKLLFLGLFLLSACAYNAPVKLTDNEKDKVIEQLIATKDFLGIFRRIREVGDPFQRGGPPRVSRAATAYIKACCAKKEDAFKLLRSNGFKISDQPIKIKPEYRALGIDEAYSAETSAHPILRGPLLGVRKYRVVLYLKNSEVQNVLALVETDTI
jgi:hypothetical protein